MPLTGWQCPPIAASLISGVQAAVVLLCVMPLSCPAALSWDDARPGERRVTWRAIPA